MKIRFFSNASLLIVPQVNSRETQIGRFFLFFLLIISLALYGLTPKYSSVSMPLFYFCFLLMLLSNYIYFRAKKKKNYLDFDTIFIFVYCLVGFSTTFVYNDDLLFRAIFVGFPVETYYINASNLLFLLGLQAYMLGSLSKTPNVDNSEKKATIIKTQTLGFIIIFLCFAFVASGGISYYRSVYDTSIDSEGPGISKHILLLLISTSIAAIVTEFYNKKNHTDYKINRLVLSSIFIVVCLLLWAGNRTAGLQLVLPIVCLYAMLFRNISIKSFLGLTLLGIILMWGIQNTRSNVEFKVASPILLISDLTIPARTTPCALDYVDGNGYTYGKSMAMGVIGIIPFFPSLAVSLDEDLLTGSAELLTHYTFDVYKTPPKFQIGLGVTIIADIYLAFGLIGVLLLMYILGYFINKYTMKALLLNYYSLVIMGGMLANAIFLVRASYTHPIRFTLWALFIAYLNKNLFIRCEK